MESFWNSLNKVDLIRLISQWIAGVSAIIALIFSMRYSTLKSQIDLKKDKEQEQTKTELKDAHTKITELEIKTKPVPLNKRLIACLDGIDKRIIPSLRSGNTKFEGNLVPYQLAELQRLSAEDAAHKYIILVTESGIVFGSNGTSTPVRFELKSILLQ